jgi:hypothetical protein
LNAVPGVLLLGAPVTWKWIAGALALPTTTLELVPVMVVVAVSVAVSD